MYWDYNLFTNHVVNSWDIQVLESLPGVSATVYLLYLKNRLENEWLEPQSHGGCLEDEFHFQKKTCVSGSILIFWGGTPLKINREHNHGGLSLEDHFPFQMGDL